MSDKFKNSKFYRTLKNPKVSRALYISLVLLLIAVAIVIGITAAANRYKRSTGQNGSGTPSDTTIKPSDSTAPIVTTAPNTTPGVTDAGAVTGGDTPV